MSAGTISFSSISTVASAPAPKSLPPLNTFGAGQGESPFSQSSAATAARQQGRSDRAAYFSHTPPALSPPVISSTVGAGSAAVPGPKISILLSAALIFIICLPFHDIVRIHVYYTLPLGPFSSKKANYVPIVEQTAKEHNIPFRAIRIASREQAQNAPTPVTTYALFRDGEYLTNEQMNGAMYLKPAAR
ncbi:MAG: YoaP domain-containing protein [Oscillospiraceae bacterium]|nr:YoaP domain-containing protein [Oscillospiraceae bacterium]